MSKAQLPNADAVIIPMPADIEASLAIILRHRAKRCRKATKSNAEIKAERMDIIIEILRRGVEAYYGGVKYVPVEEWQPYQYRYRIIRTQRKRTIKVEIDDTEQNRED